MREGLNDVMESKRGLGVSSATPQGARNSHFGVQRGLMKRAISNIDDSLLV